MAGEKPMISVIVPVYNAAPYLGQCLDSLGAQTYTNLEIILVNDASLDGSGKICDNVASKDIRVQVIHFPSNRGPSAARNEGIRMAGGRYISFVDADDTAEPALLEKLYESLIQNEADVSACGADGICIESGPAALFSQEEAMQCLAQGSPFNLVPWAKLYRAGLVKENLFDERIFYSEDLLFLYELFKQVDRVSYIPDNLYHYHCREGSQVHSGMSQRKYTALLAQDYICRDAKIHFPQTAPGFCCLTLSADLCMAILAIKHGAEEESCISCLKKLQANIRRHFSLRVLSFFPRKKDQIELVILYLSVLGFWGIAVIYEKYIKALKGR